MKRGLDWVRVGDWGEVLGGKQKVLPGSPGLPRKYLRVANVFDGYIDGSDVLEMPFTDREFEKLRLLEGDILLNEGQSLELVGRTSMYRGEPGSCAFQNSLIRFRAGTNCDATFAEELFRYLQQAGKFVSVALKTTSIAHLGVSRFANFRITVPSLSVQQRLASALNFWSKLDGCLSSLICAKRRLKRALMQRLIPDSADPSRVRLGKLTREITRRNDAGLGSERVMGVIKSEGLVPMRERLMADDLARYRVVPPRAFAYNPMRINIGSIAYSWHEADVLVSPDYVAFECDEERLEPRYLDHIRRSSSWTSFMERAGNGSVRVRIYYADLAQFCVALPTLGVQRKVARLLDALDNEVALLEQQMAALREQKRAVMRKLLSGEIDLPDGCVHESPAPEAESS